MLLLTLATLVTLLARHVSAHARLFRVSLDGKDQGDGLNKYIRSPATNDPVRDLSSAAIVCNTQVSKAAPDFVRAAAGDRLTFLWAHDNPDDPADYVLDPSHKGAILTYVAAYPSGDPTGPIWSKLAEEGFTGGQWATIKMIDNGGKVDVTLPEALAPGKYLIRQELLALHQADFACDDPAHPNRGAESYPNCVQVEVSGSGDKKPDQNFDFNKGYTCDNKGLHFNIYIGQDSQYVAPGPRPWNGS